MTYALLPVRATAPPRAAAYTRTGILRRFLDQLAHSDPGKVDSAYAGEELGLKGGDVRAFLQSLRVLGIIDPYGYTTDRARRMRAGSQRGAVLQEALAEAYPELVARWSELGGMPREEVEDFFKVEYGLSASSAAPAAKLFVDLMREHAPGSAPRPVAAPRRISVPPEPAVEAELPETSAFAPTVAAPSDLRAAALEAMGESLRIEINSDWEPEKISLVFDRMERLVGRILGES